MPTVLRVAGFRVVIFLPPREHAPPHVHVQKAGGEMVIELASPEGPPVIRSVAKLRSTDVVRAFRIVEDNSAFLLEEWRKHHGQDDEV